MPPVNSMDLPRTMRVLPTITIYGPHDCPNCDKAIQLFDGKGIAYTKVDLEPGDENHRHVTEKLGYQQTPVITVKLEGQRTVHWGGHRMDVLMALGRLCAEGVASDHKEASR
ncbi:MULTISPECIES: glutaredoxin family protein [Streptomyces]|nr:MULTISPECIES: glutaredoxin family protein [Streptomyces]MDX3275566.1 glutaredoxin family protein [Streptomyces scabiei]MDX3848032.1 glutaredoxin family protein [Streptomyces europaeiscabiei]